MTEFRDPDTRKRRWEQIDDDLPYAPAELDRRAVVPDQIRTIVRTLRDSLQVMFPDLVDERFETWMLQQSNAGRTFTHEQAEYLHLIKRRIATHLGIAPAELAPPPFSTKGGLGKARQLFGDDLDTLLDELTATLAA